MKFFVINVIFTLLVLLLAMQVSSQQLNIDSNINEAWRLVYDDPEKAIALAEEIESEISKLDIDKKINILLVIGAANSSERKHQIALKCCLEAYEIALEAKNHVYQLKTLGAVANQYYIMEMFDKVNLYLDKEEKILEKHPIADSLNYIIGNLYLLRAMNYKENLDCNVAIDYFNKSIDAYKSFDHQTNLINMSIVYIHKAKCMEEIGLIDSAELFYNEALDISSKFEIIGNIIYSRIGISNILYKKGEYNAAIDILNEFGLIKNESVPLDIQIEVFAALEKNYLKLNHLNNYKIYSSQLIQAIAKLDQADRQSIQEVLNEQHEMYKNKLKEEKAGFSYLQIVIYSLLFVSILFMIFKIVGISKKMKKLQ